MPPARSYHRPDAARARRALAIAGAVIVAGQLAAGLALDAAPRQVRFPAAATVLDRAHAVDDAPFVLLLGSSRFWRIDVGTVGIAMRTTLGVTPPPVLNASVQAGDAVVADYLLEALVAQGSHPDLVALEISPETLACPAPWVAEHAIRFFTWKDVVAWAPEILFADRMSRVAAARFFPIQTYRKELLTWIVGTAPPYLRVRRPGPPRPVQTPGRATPVVPPPVAAPARAPQAVKPEQPKTPGPSAWTIVGLRQPRRWLRHYHPDGGEARSLERVLARCHDQGIHVVLVGVPVTSLVRDLYTPEIEHLFRDEIERVARRYDAEFVDYRGRISDIFFKDHHHLNDRGGIIFSRMLADEVLATRWPPQASAPPR